MLYEKTLESFKEHYGLDEIYAEPDFDREHISPCGTHIVYEHRIFVRKGDLKFTFHTAIHWHVERTEVPWYEIWNRVFVGKEIIKYSVDHSADSEYLMHMILAGMEQGQTDE